MSTAVESAHAGLVAIVGASRVVTEAASCVAFAVDGRVPSCVVYPPGAGEVAAVLKLAAERNLAVVPCGNATKLSTGNLPRRYDIALSLKEMNRVWHYEPEDLTLSAEPGMRLGDFQDSVGRHGLWLPLDPAGGRRASLGGIVATNACGPLRLAYGAPRDMVLGMKIANTDGKLIKSGGRVVKNVAGYDMGKLLIGSHGTLGVIVEVSFKLFPRPAQRATCVLAGGTLGIARDLRRSILASPLTPLRMVLADAAAATLVRRGTSAAAESKEPEVWIEFGGSERVLERCSHEVGQLAQAVGSQARKLDSDVAETVWARVSDFGGWLAQTVPGPAVAKAVLPDSASEEFLSRAQQEAAGERLNLVGLAQMGVGVVQLGLYGARAEAVLPGLLARLRASAQELRGALVVERCPPELKERVETWGPPGDDFRVMAKLKAAWDPKGILSPGRFLGGL